ncbi:hypothetical protein LEP1GSC047_4178 [Leptospira inadai serovar Lyme str. 10]|uniref:Uncharacterized protein n=1 Tax=Leptospira inadai serovar Lyme str. 10 TaxID=1049790 RepID=V6HDK5_9LEPT|nr:hypothetical protein LEP1GSC047_4178 [Leptospira inadai serovar Lyme str. 10]
MLEMSLRNVTSRESVVPKVAILRLGHNLRLLQAEESRN